MSPRRRVMFPASQNPSPAAPAVGSIGPLVLSARFRGSGVRTFDLSTLPCPRLVRNLLLALSGLAGVENGQSCVQTTAEYVASIRCLTEFIAESVPHGAALFDVADVPPQLLEAFESRLISRYSEVSRLPYQRMQHVVRLLRLVCDRQPELVSAEMQARLAFTTVRSSNAGGRPVDAYPAMVFDAIHAAAMADVRAIRERLLHGERLATEGHDPAGAGWAGWTLPNALWHVAHRGPITPQLEGGHGARARIKELGGIGRLNSCLFLTPHDLVPLLVLLICQTGLEPEVVCELRADCLVNPARGYVSIRYVKKRAHGYSHKTLRVSDGGGLHHPGGLIRMIMRLTAYGRRLTGTDLLWTHVNRFGRVAASFETWRQTVLLRQKQEWMDRHSINEITPERYTLDLRRLRKSYKSRRYVLSSGVLDDFAEGHTKRVAARHYADIEAHRHVHEEAVEAGLREALQVAAGPTVILSGDGSRLDSTGADLAPAEVAAALSGDNDVWLASCKDFYGSPFALKPGAGCPVAIWGCIECPNAVFTTRHLPSILSFLAFMYQEQERLPGGEWQTRYASAAERIVTGICPQFSSEQLETARAIAEGDDEHLRLPAQMLELMT